MSDRLSKNTNSFCAAVKAKSALELAAVKSQAIQKLNDIKRQYRQKLRQQKQQQQQQSFCNASCRAKKKRDELLYMNYVDAQENLKNAPIKLDNAEKDYYISAFGQAKYDDLRTSKYKKEIKDIISKERNNFENSIKNVNKLIDNYNRNILLNNKLDELINNVSEENDVLNEKIDSITSTINTNERKVYYDDKQILNIKKFSKYFMYLFIVIYIIFLIILLIYKKELFNIKFIVMFTILFSIPYFLIPYMSIYIVNLYYYITNKNPAGPPPPPPEPPCALCSQRCGQRRCQRN